jgi:hypothetical protein
VGEGTPQAPAAATADTVALNSRRFDCTERLAKYRHLGKGEAVGMAVGYGIVCVGGRSTSASR